VEILLVCAVWPGCDGSVRPPFGDCAVEPRFRFRFRIDEFGPGAKMSTAFSCWILQYRVYVPCVNGERH
jgi:hypothetical protein